MKSKKPIWLIFPGSLLAGVLLLVSFQASIKTNQAQALPELAGSFDFDRLFDSITGEDIKAWHDKIAGQPTRLSGSDGDIAASKLAEERYRALGMEVHIQRFPVTVPVTKRCELLSVSGENEVPVAGVKLSPFWPNVIRTCTTPPEGIVATVIDGGTGALEDLDGKEIEGNIIVVKMTPEFDWVDAAKMGASAILFRYSDQPFNYRKKILHFPADIPRFLVEGNIDAFIGRKLKLVARVDWEIREARNVYGILRPATESSEAVFLMGYSDSWSVIPDRAPGDNEATTYAGLMSVAGALAEQRKGLGRNLVFATLSGRCLMTEGVRRLLDVLGNRETFDDNRKRLMGRRDVGRRKKEAMEQAASVYQSDTYWTLDEAEHKALLNRLTPEAKTAFSETFQSLIDRYVRDMQDLYAKTKLAWVEAGRPNDGRAFDAQLEAAGKLRRARAAAGADPGSIRSVFSDVVDQAGCREQLGPALETAVGHARQAFAWQEDSVHLSNVLRPFKLSYYYMIKLTPNAGATSYGGDSTLSQEMERASDSVVRQWLKSNDLPADDPSLYPDRIANRRRVKIGKPYSFGVGENNDVSYLPLHLASHALFGFDGRGGSKSYQTPLREPIVYDDVAVQSQLLAGLAAQMASGVEPMGIAGKADAPIISWFSDYGGEVLSTSGSKSILASRRVSDVLVVLKGVGGKNGFGTSFTIQKSRDGSFRFPAVVPGNAESAVMCDAYTIDERTGVITGARDMGIAGQKYENFFGKWDFYKEPEERVTIPLANLAPMDIYRLVGTEGRPLKPEILNAHFRTIPDEFAVWAHKEEGATVLVRPGDYFYVVLKEEGVGRGAPLEDKGFLMGYAPGEKPDLSETEFWGPGYLAGRDHRVVFQESDAAASVAASNRERLDAQVKQGLGDPASLEFAGKADLLLDKAFAALADKNYSDAYRNLTTSLAISNRAYPLVRRAVADAITGLLLYMFLLVPFSVFSERLLLGANDIRVRLLGTFAIFLVVFLLIRALHPVYELVSSGMIVLVGFTIFMLCLLILGFLSGKFAERIRELRHRGKGSGEAESEVSRTSATETAFSLGINSMRKRKVRTAYTLATLILISFSMVCFTSPHPELVIRDIVVGQATFNGVLLRQVADLTPLRLQFKDKARIIQRRGRSWEKGPPPRGRAVIYKPDEGASRSAIVHTLLILDWEEPILTGLDRLLLPGGRWFNSNEEDAIILSDDITSTLGIDSANLKHQEVSVFYGGRELRVIGVIAGSGLDGQEDVDGNTFLPPDESPGSIAQKASASAQAGGLGGAAVNTYPVPGADVAILSLNPAYVEGSPNDHTSAVVVFNDLPYGEIREMIDTVMDRMPTYFSYALDGVSYIGGKLRSVGIEGLIDLVVPLLIASLIVFSTMLGSVFERQKEISVFSAVGLSPRHVFYLFLVESLVYAVIGVVGGYVLGLGLQGLSHAGGGFLGLAIDYSSRSAVYVCLTIMAAVIASTFLPAWRAAKIASPSGRVTWSMPPETKPGSLDFELPFTYLGRDIFAVVPFLTSWFDERGEDSSGEFSASPPGVEVTWEGDNPQFNVETTVWLRPYDLGVSQRVCVSIKPSDDANIYIVGIRIDQLAGNLASWRRTNKRFVSILRRHFLGWRVVSTKNKELLFNKCEQMMQVAVS